jgi:thiamine biosynthesis lipoprotein ApbE
VNPEVLALLAVACLAPAAEPARFDPALGAAMAALQPAPVAASPAPAEVAAALAAVTPPRRRQR